MNGKSALIVVDVQNDFLPTGALPVKNGDQVVPVINRLIGSNRFDHVVATQDWHPANHGSFAANHPGKRPGDLIDLHGLRQILWPVHCVEMTRGADFAPGLAASAFNAVIRKGTDTTIDSYSGFFDNGHRKATKMEEWLKEHGVTDLYVTGLATDYCVKFTVLDGLKLGFKLHLVEDACRGVNLQANDVDQAIDEMRKKGADVIQHESAIAGADTSPPKNEERGA